MRWLITQWWSTSSAWIKLTSSCRSMRSSHQKDLCRPKTSKMKSCSNTGRESKTNSLRSSGSRRSTPSRSTLTTTVSEEESSPGHLAAPTCPSEPTSCQDQGSETMTKKTWSARSTPWRRQTTKQCRQPYRSTPVWSQGLTIHSSVLPKSDTQLTTTRTWKGTLRKVIPKCGDLTRRRDSRTPLSERQMVSGDSQLTFLGMVR